MFLYLLSDVRTLGHPSPMTQHTWLNFDAPCIVSICQTWCRPLARWQCWLLYRIISCSCQPGFWPLIREHVFHVLLWWIQAPTESECIYRELVVRHSNRSQESYAAQNTLLGPRHTPQWLRNHMSSTSTPYLTSRVPCTTFARVHWKKPCY